MSLIARTAYGLSDIHVAVFDEKTGTYGEPVWLEGSKEVEVELSYEHSPISGENRTEYIEAFAGGEGTVSVLSLNSTECNMIFGHTKIGENGTLVKSTDKAPTIALGFAQKKDGGKTGYWIYSVKCKPAPISASTIEEGKVEDQPVSIEFTVAETADNGIYYKLDKIPDTFFDSVPINPTAPVVVKKG